jgi:PAS domain S-box-containing protein
MTRHLPVANPPHHSFVSMNWRKTMIWKLFSNHDPLPHGFCYQWKPALIWLHAISDTLIALAYFLIPIALIYFVRRRRNLPFSWMFVCFGVFISACGATHLMEVWTIWVPSYWLSGGVKVITALASVPTALSLVHLMPKALSLPSPDEMRAANEELNRQAAALKKTEERFRQMADNIQEIFWILDPQTMGVSYVSPAFEQICELPLDSLYSNPTSYRELIHLQDRPRVLAELGKLERTNHFDEEFRIVCPGGTVKWIRAIGFTAKDPTGDITTLVGTAQEITARKEMEIVMCESEDRYRDLVEHSTDLICTHDLEGRLLSVNELPVKLLGYSREELLNKPMRDLLLPEARAQFDQSLLDIQRDGFVRGLMVVLTKTGERRVWEYHNTLRTDGVTAPVVRGVAHDVTEKRRVEKALRLSEEKFSKAFHSSPVEIMITALEEGRLLDVNESFERNSGFNRAEVIGHTTIELGLWHDPDERTEVVEKIKKDGRVQDREISFRSKWGRPRVKRYSAEQIKIAGKQCLLQVCEDITLRKQMGEALRLSEEKFSKAFRNSPSIISISTLKAGAFLEINESFEKHTGYGRNELLGRTAADIGLWVDPNDRASLLDEIEKRGFARGKEVAFRAKSGQVVVVLLSVEPIELSGVKCLLAVGQDITDRKRAEEELQHLSGRLLQSQDEERRRIARDLHDSTGQDLVALATMLGQLRVSIPTGGQKSRRLLSECSCLADRCLGEVRTLSYVLHPPVLDDTGLVGAIRDYVKGFTKRSGVQVKLELSSPLGRMPRDVELALFRVVQESLTNIHRHSGSRQAKIRIDRNSNLTLEISDPGEGPSAGAPGGQEEPRPGVGVGVHSMQERVKLIGGRLEVDFTSHGTTVRVTLPLGGKRA